MKTFESLNISGINISKGGNQKVFCPICHSERKNKHDRSLSVNVPQGVGICHNCGWKFTLKEFEKKVYYRPEPSPLPLSDKTKKWFESRGISESTLRFFKVTESKQWMPSKGSVKDGERNCINFNYYKGDDLVNIKFRDAAKCFRLVKDAELIFYNLNAISSKTEAIICEGEIDALTFHECGFPMVVSVPNGASKGSSRLEYLDNCIDYLLDKEKIFIAVDGDEAGQALKEELIRRLGIEKCFEIKYPEGCKDANEVLMKFDKGEVAKLITEAKEPPVKGIFQINDLDERLDDIYLHGYPKALPIGYKDLDKLIKWRKGELTIITGIPSHGKSNFLDQIMVRLAIRNNWRFGVFSPENQPAEIHIIQLFEKFVGKPYHRYDNTPTMNEATKNYAKQQLNDSFYFMKIDEIDLTIDGILEKAKELVQRKGIDALVIDPYNYIEHNVPSGYSETQYISELLTKIKRFKDKNNIHVFLIAHPRKIGKLGKQHDIPTLYDIAGSAHFYNKADNGITVYRNDESNIVDVHIQKVRFRFVGKKGMVSFTYDLPTGRFAERDTNYESEMDYIINAVKQPQMFEKVKDFTEPQREEEDWQNLYK